MLPAVPTEYAYGSLVAAMLADTLTLMGGVNVKYGLIAANFEPSRALLYGDLVQPTFTGYAEKAAPAVSARVVRDPTNGGFGFAMAEPTTGLTWEATAAPAAPETIYGWYVHMTTGAHLLFTQKFDTPIVIANIFDFVEVSAVLGYLDFLLLTELEA